MKMPLFVWDPDAPNERVRWIFGISVPVYVLVIVNHYAGWRLFGAYDRVVFGAVLFTSFLACTVLSVPWPEERERRPLSYWIVTALLMLTGLGILLI